MSMRRKIRLLALITLIASLAIFATFGTAFASSIKSSAQSVSSQVNISGTWMFTTTDSIYPTFTLTLQQYGAKLSGQDQGGQPVKGRVNGFSIRFHVKGVNVEDDYGGKGTISHHVMHMSGTFWDGFGGGGTFTATRSS